MSEGRFQYPAVRPEWWTDLVNWPLRVALCDNIDVNDTDRHDQWRPSAWLLREYSFTRHLIEDFDDWRPHVILTHWHGRREIVHPISESDGRSTSERLDGVPESPFKQLGVHIGSEREDAWCAPVLFAEHLRAQCGDDVRNRPLFWATHWGDPKPEDTATWATRARLSFDLFSALYGLFLCRVPVICYSLWHLLGSSRQVIPLEQIIPVETRWHSGTEDVSPETPTERVHRARQSYAWGHRSYDEVSRGRLLETLLLGWDEGKTKRVIELWTDSTPRRNRQDQAR